MERFHVFGTRSRSGIARYGESFFRHVLGPAGYVHLEPEEVPAAMRRLGGERTAVWHLELGAHQFAERDAFVALSAAGFRNLDLTVHEPPFLTFPFFHFRSPLANRVSRGLDWYLHSLGAQARAARRARRSFVLSERGADWLRRRQGVTAVEVIPHVVEPAAIWGEGPPEGVQDLAFFGFIGRSKGLEQALAFHAAIRAEFPDVGMHVVGQASSPRDQAALDGLRRRYADGVRYHGYVPEERLDDVFRGAAHVLLPFAPFRWFCPVSGSILHGLRRGRVVWASDVNAVRETIEPGRNGLLLTGDLSRDLATYRELRARPERRAAISAAALATARRHADHDYSRHFRDAPGRPS